MYLQVQKDEASSNTCVPKCDQVSDKPVSATSTETSEMVFALQDQQPDGDVSNFLILH